MQTVLVTGANGFVGFYLVQKLLQKGYFVFATGKGACRLPFVHPQFAYHELDFTCHDATVASLKSLSPQVVIHAGAITSPDACELQKELAWEVNVAGTENLLAAAAQTGAQFLYVSTDFVFKGNKEVYTENDAPDPVNYYGVTKMEAEKRVQAYSGLWTIVRPILLYGHPMTGKANILTFVADGLRKGKTLQLFTDQQRLPTYVLDFAWGLHRLLEQKKTGIYHFCGEDLLSPYDIGLKVARHLQLDASLIEPAMAKTFRQPAARPTKTVFDLGKVKKALGYKPTSFDEAMQETFSACRSNLQ